LSHKSVTQIYHKRCFLNQTPLSTTHVVYHGMLTIYKSNTPFPVTRHKYITKCDKDISQPFFEDLNKSLSLLIISYHYINSVTVRSSTTHQVCACCRLSRSTSWTSWPLKMGPIGYPKTSERNYHFILHTIPEKSRSQNTFNFSVSFHQKNAKWLNINVFCDITSENTV